MCNLASVDLPSKSWENISTPKTDRQLNGPNYWEHFEMAKRQLS